VVETPSVGLKIGTESKGDFRNIRFRNCKIVNTAVGVGVYIKDGAVVENLVVENIEMSLCPPTYHEVVPLFIDIERRHETSKVGTVRNVAFRDIRITGGAGILMQGMPESLLQNVTLKNITMDVKEPQDYAHRKKPLGGRRTTRDPRDKLYARAATWAAVANVQGLTVDGFHVNVGEEDFNKFPRSALALFNVQGGQIQDVTRIPTASGPPAVESNSCKQVSGLPPAP
jgi:hypothetical protein